MAYLRRQTNIIALDYRLALSPALRWIEDAHSTLLRYLSRFNARVRKHFHASSVPPDLRRRGERRRSWSNETLRRATAGQKGAYDWQVYLKPDLLHSIWIWDGIIEAGLEQDVHVDELRDMMIMTGEWIEELKCIEKDLLQACEAFSTEKNKKNGRRRTF